MLERTILALGLVAAIGTAIVWSETNRAGLRDDNAALTSQLETALWKAQQADNARQTALDEAVRHKATADKLRADMATIIREGLGDEMLDPALRDILNRRMRDENGDSSGSARGGP